MIPLSPAPLIDLVLRSANLLCEAHTVINLRLCGLAGLWPMNADEPHRMLSEKGPAWITAATLGQRALFAGQRPDQILLATIEPLQRETHSNCERLLRGRS